MDELGAAPKGAGRSGASHRFSNALRYRDEADPRQVHLTPSYILEPIRSLFGGRIALDPCTEPDNPTRAEAFYAPPVDGAAQPWTADGIYVNPPYGKARERWVARCVEAGSRGLRVVLLIPAHPDTRVFQRALATATSVVFIRGRVKFGVLRPNRRQVAASHPSALLGWNVDLSVTSLGETVRSVEVDPRFRRAATRATQPVLSPPSSEEWSRLLDYLEVNQPADVDDVIAVLAVRAHRAEKRAALAATPDNAGRSLDALRALSDEATPGRWSTRRIEDAKDDWWAVDAPGDPPMLAMTGPEDAAFIVAAVNYVRARLSESTGSEMLRPDQMTPEDWADKDERP